MRRYEQERGHLVSRLQDDLESVEVTSFGSAKREFVYLHAPPDADDFIALARGAYVRGELTAQELEVEIERALREDW